MSFLSITEAATLRRELERSVARVATLRRVLALDGRARIERVEGAFAARCFSAERLVGLRFIHLVNASDRTAVAELIKRVLRECANGEVDMVL